MHTNSKPQVKGDIKVKVKISQTGLAAALVAIGCSAQAQSSVTISGVIDLGYVYGKGSIAQKTALQSGNNQGSRLVFSGREDLGNGYAAGFALDAGFNADDGTGSASNTNNQSNGTSTAAFGFNRRSFLSFYAPWGEVRMGRDYTTTFKNQATFDPWGLNGVGIAVTLNPTFQGPAAVRVSNMVSYTLPSLGGFYGELQHYLGENASNVPNKNDGTGTNLRFGYANGPVNVGAAYATTTYLAGNAKRLNVGVSYDFGPVKAMGQLERDKVGEIEGKSWLIGMTAPLGNGELRASYGAYRIEKDKNPEYHKLALGYVYNFSKQTVLYGSIAEIRNTGGSTQALGGGITAANKNARGIELGIRKNF
jgi:predicted porin